MLVIEVFLNHSGSLVVLLPLLLPPLAIVVDN